MCELDVTVAQGPWLVWCRRHTTDEKKKENLVGWLVVSLSSRKERLVQDCRCSSSKMEPNIKAKCRRNKRGGMPHAEAKIKGIHLLSAICHPCLSRGS